MHRLPPQTAEQFDKARHQAYKGDFSIVIELCNPDCTHFDHLVGLEINLDIQSAVISAYENTTFGAFRILYEDEDYLCIHRYVQKNSVENPLTRH